jgi:hypothetical protein
LTYLIPGSGWLTGTSGLQYQKETDLAPPLLLDALSSDAAKEPLERQKFKAYRSLRDVEATVNLWIRDPYSMDNVEDEGT